MKDVKVVSTKRKLQELDGIRTKKARVSFAGDSHPPSPPRRPSSPSYNKVKEHSHFDYQNSPLLTPKEEDHDDDDDNDLCNNEYETETKDLRAPISPIADTTPKTASETTTPATIATPTEIAPTETTSVAPESDLDDNSDALFTDLNTNPDYISLTSSHKMLKRSEGRIVRNIARLLDIQKQVTALQSKDEIVDLVVRLINNDLDLPQTTRVLRAPIVDWSRYHPALAKVAKDFTKTDSKGEALFKTLDIWGK